MSITIGMKGTATKIVTENDTAKVVKSGSLPVLATPVLSALMEEAACDAVKEGLTEGETTVGGFIGLAHKQPTPSAAPSAPKPPSQSSKGRRSPST